MRCSHAVSDRSRDALDCRGLCQNRTWDHLVHHYLALGELEHRRERWRGCIGGPYTRLVGVIFGYYSARYLDPIEPLRSE